MGSRAKKILALLATTEVVPQVRTTPVYNDPTFTDVSDNFKETAFHIDENSINMDIGLNNENEILIDSICSLDQNLPNTSNVIILSLDEPIRYHITSEGKEIATTFTNSKTSENAITQNDVDLPVVPQYEGTHLISSNMVFKTLVDYELSASSDEEHENKPTQVPTSKRLRRHSSDYSFHENLSNTHTEDEDSNSDTAWENLTVNKTCFKKKRKIQKKNINKAERTYGANKSVKANPCRKNCPNQCILKFPEIVRQDIHEFYWGLGSCQRQRDFLLSCIKEEQIKRRKQAADQSRRHKSYKYLIPWNDFEHAVCQQFLLKTLDISQMTLRYTKNNSLSSRCSKIDQRGRHHPPNKTSRELKQNVLDFIMQIPCVPSHYCRNKTTRKYLPVEFRNISFLYGIFKNNQRSSNKNEFVSLQVFRSIFKNEFNLGFHLPKKDKCTMCEIRKDKDYEETESSKQAYEEHVKNKTTCKDVFLADQKVGLNDSTFLCVSFDLQKVLNTPHGDNLLLYYARKYAFYNLTVYENITQNSFCFIWGECDGGRGSNEISTIMYKYLEEVDKRKAIKHVSLNCDSCYGQNKNKAMITMICYFLKKSSTIESINIRYLLPGHTFMPVDSVHATIERFIRRRIIWAPSEWTTLISNARTNPKPLETIKMDFTDFLDWKKVSNETLNARKFKTVAGEAIQISKIKNILFKKRSTAIVVDYSYDEADLKTIKVDLSNKKPKRVYSQKLTINIQKKKDLIDLCDKNIIPLRYQNEYRQMRTSASTVDALPQTDDEDPSDNQES